MLVQEADGVDERQVVLVVFADRHQKRSGRFSDQSARGDIGRDGFEQIGALEKGQSCLSFLLGHLIGRLLMGISSFFDLLRLERLECGQELPDVLLDLLFIGVEFGRRAFDEGGAQAGDINRPEGA